MASTINQQIWGQDARAVAIGLSLVFSALMFVGKFAAFGLTGSAAIFSDAAESAVHVVATAFVAFSLWYATRPPDAGHPYGHGKVAYFAMAVEGLLIIGAALFIIYAASVALWVGPELQQLGMGLLIVGVLALMNLALGLFLLRVGRQTNSIILTSNGHHILTDMWTSLGVLIGVGLVWLTDVVWLDPVVAVAVALNILWTGSKLVARSVEGLMERAEEEATEKLLDTLHAAVEADVASDFHQVRHRRVDDQRFIEYHLQFPSDLSLAEAHDRSHYVEQQIMEQFPGQAVVVTAHLEPEGHVEAHPADHVEPPDPLQSTGQAQT